MTISKHVHKKIKNKKYSENTKADVEIILFTSCFVHNSNAFVIGSTVLACDSASFSILNMESKTMHNTANKALCLPLKFSKAFPRENGYRSFGIKRQLSGFISVYHLFLFSVCCVCISQWIPIINDLFT